MEELIVLGAKENNLKNINVSIPKNKFIVITGLSGSGKSSLAFNTIYAEGQRRFMETFSSYARFFIGSLNKPKVDKISGLSPVISIEQKTTNKNPRSTVGTSTEIYDYLRLLYSKISIAYSYKTGEQMISYSIDRVIDTIMNEYINQKIYILSPIIRSRKGHYQELFQDIAKKGFIKVRVDGEIKDIVDGMKLDRFKTHDIEIVIDTLLVSLKNKKRLSESIKTAMKFGDDLISVINRMDGLKKYFSKHLMCPTTGISYPSPEPNTFSFNSPKGSCSKCNGLGYNSEIDINKIINKNQSIKNGGIIPISKNKDPWILEQIEIIGKKFNFNLSTLITDIPKEGLDAILYGLNDSFKIENKKIGINKTYNLNFEGIYNFIKNEFKNSRSIKIKRWAKEFMHKSICHECNGDRLKKKSLYFKIDKKNISEVSKMEIINLKKWIDSLHQKLSIKEKKISNEIITELNKRISFLLNVGLEYLSLNRTMKTLSGGESQRIRLATQVGTHLTDVLYILDEPSIGLHQRDNNKLIKTLKELRDLGNSIIVVEHDKDMIVQSDYVIDMGPESGENGGYITSIGNYNDFIKNNSLTAQYLNKTKQIRIPKKRRKGNGNHIILNGANGNNLKNINIKLPLGKFICVTGVSGSGKSSLINETLYPIINKHFYKSIKKPLPYKEIFGLENIDKIIEINQHPIGRTPRSNPATYTGVFSEIRSLFSSLPESKVLGYKSGQFSFNVSGGRCEKCKGAGLNTIEMNFLPDVQVKCEECKGERYNEETLNIKFKNKSISDVLNMTIDEAILFFDKIPNIKRKIKTLKDVGLGYIKLGQQSTTLSGGEAQRIKLASELSKKGTGKTVYILDEPTTGLHFHDIKILINVLEKLIDKGNTVIVIEHNMDVIKMADFIIDIGPEGGKNGGNIVFSGTPEEIIKVTKSHTGTYLKYEL